MLDTSHPNLSDSPLLRFITRVRTRDFRESVSRISQEEKLEEVVHSLVPMLREAKMALSDRRYREADRRLVSESSPAPEHSTSWMKGMSRNTPDLRPVAEMRVRG